MGSRRVHYSIGRGGEATGGGTACPLLGGEWKRDPVWVVFRACSGLHAFTNRLTESLDEACVAREDDSTCNGHITMREFTTEPPKNELPTPTVSSVAEVWKFLAEASLHALYNNRVNNRVV